MLPDESNVVPAGKESVLAVGGVTATLEVKPACPTSIVDGCPFENAKTLLTGTSNSVSEIIARIFFIDDATKPKPLLDSHHLRSIKE